MAYDFDGVNDWVGNTTTPPVSGVPCTIACFFNGGSSGQHFVNICNTAGSDSFRLALNTAYEIQANSVVNNNAVGAATTTTYSPGGDADWAHACAVYASSTSRTAYLNGGGAATNTSTSNPTGFTRIQIGARRVSSTNDNFFSGRIGEVGVWSAALTAKEIEALAAGVACSKIRPQSLVFYAPMIRTLQDISRSKITLTANGGVDRATNTKPHPKIYL